MAQRLMHDDESAAELRRGLAAAERAAGGGSWATGAETSKAEAAAKAEEKKNKRGVLSNVTAPVVAAPKATFEGIKGGGEHIANAIVPPPGHPEGAASRSGEALLGAINTA